MFRIVPEVTPYAWMLSRKTDCRNMQLPPYAGNLVFMLPVKDEKPSTHTITIKLCQGVSQCKGTQKWCVNHVIDGSVMGMYRFCRYPYSFS